MEVVGQISVISSREAGGGHGQGSRSGYGWRGCGKHRGHKILLFLGARDSGLVTTFLSYLWGIRLGWVQGRLPGSKEEEESGSNSLEFIKGTD